MVTLWNLLLTTFGKEFKSIIGIVHLVTSLSSDQKAREEKTRGCLYNCFLAILQPPQMKDIPMATNLKVLKCCSWMQESKVTRMTFLPTTAHFIFMSPGNIIVSNGFWKLTMFQKLSQALLLFHNPMREVQQSPNNTILLWHW